MKAPALDLTPGRPDAAWQAPNTVSRYLNGVRAALPMAAEQIAVMLKLLAAGPRPVARFLDLGCGDGILGAAILEMFPAAHGLLADFSEPMLAAARRSLSAHAAQLTFSRLDYADPGWVSTARPAGPFDAIVSGYSIHHQPDDRKQALYVEIFDLLQPGGWFVNVEHVAPAGELTTMLFNEHIIDAWFSDRRKGDPTLERGQVAAEFHNREDRVANILAPVEVQCNWLRAIGFQDVDCYFKIYELAVFGGRHPER